MIKPLTERQRAKLQRMIDRTARTNAAYHKEQAALMTWCETHYGFTPSDIDADFIIDGLLGGAGSSMSMPADEFDQIMRDGAP